VTAGFGFKRRISTSGVLPIRSIMVRFIVG
jgi:hypothetical protein